MKTSFFTVLLCLLVILNFMFCSKDSPTEPKKTLDQELQEALDNTLAFYNCKGVSAAVLIPGSDIWVGVSGVSHGTILITSNMLFCIGSVTKTYIATLTLLLAEEGKLSLEDSLYKWLPNYQNIDSTVTIRQLLNHTSGIYNTSENPTMYGRVFSDLTKIWSPEETITEFVLEPYHAPGAGYHYANSNYILLGMIIKEVTGSQVSTELRRRLFEPLDLNSTFFYIEEEITGTLAHPWWDYDFNESLDDLTTLSWNADFSTTWTAGIIFSTAEDVVKWSNALFHEKVVLNQSSLDQMLDFYPTDDGGYGLGIRLFPDFGEGVQIIGHTGTLWGYSAIMAFSPDYGVSISVILNQREGNCRDAISGALARIVLDHLKE